MTQFPTEILNQVRNAQVVATFSVDNCEHAVPIANALMAGGINVVELTLRTPAALDGIKAICDQVAEMTVGVGTILTPQQVKEVKSLGASFGVSPGLNPNVVRAAQEAGLPFAPGIATPSDLETAIELGCRFVKFFPAEASGGVTYLKSMSAPYRHLGIQYMPLGGVNSSNMQSYLDQDDVAAVGGTWIVDKQLVADGNWDGIAARAKEITQALGNQVNT